MDLTIFLHNHKCAGSTVVSSAQACGFSLPEGHKNGNLMNGDGRFVMYARMTKERLRTTLQDQVDAGVNFLAMEWDFPAFEKFPSDMPIRFVTVLRNPLVRAISNWKNDKVNRRCAEDVSFASFMDGSATFRSHNYFVRMLASLSAKDEVTLEHFNYAVSVLKKFDAVVPLDSSGRTLKQLSAVGITVKPEHHKNRFARKQDVAKDFAKSFLTIHTDELAEYCAKNHYDFALFTMFSHRRDFRAGAVGGGIRVVGAP